MLYSKFSTPSLAFAHMKQARLPFVHLSVVFLNEAAGFTLCYGLLICSHSFELLCHRASTLGFLHQLPVSYEVTWLLPRLDFHQLAINGLLGTLHNKNLPLFDKRGAGFCLYLGFLLVSHVLTRFLKNRPLQHYAGATASMRSREARALSAISSGT